MEEELPKPPTTSDTETVETELWLVSYGETDDREMTADQITRALQRQEISRNTIVWRDGMPEWVPISQVPALNPEPRAVPRPDKQRTVIGGFQAAPRPHAPGPEPTSSPAASQLPGPRRLSAALLSAQRPERGAPVEDLDSGLLESLVDFELPTPDDEAVTRELPALRDEVIAPVDEEPPSSLATLVDELPPEAMESIPPTALDATDVVVETPELPASFRRAPPPDIFDIELSTVDANEVPSPPSTRRAPTSLRAAESILAAPQEPLNAPTIQVEPLSSPAPADFAPAKGSKLSKTVAVLLLFGATVGGAFWLGQRTASPPALPPTEAQGSSDQARGADTAGPSGSRESASSAAPADAGTATEKEGPGDVESDPPKADPAAGAVQRAGGSTPHNSSPPRAPTTTTSAPQKTEKAAPKPTVEEPEPATKPFDANAASSALSSAAVRASSCRKEGDPSGMANVSVTFSPSGRAVRATISGPPFSGTATGGCIASTMRSSKIAPFVGDRVTVTKRVVIQ